MESKPSSPRAGNLEYDRIIEIAIDGFWVVDGDGRILAANEAMADLLGYTVEELKTLTLRDIEASESPEELEAHVRQIMEVGSARFETRHRRKDGSLVDVEVSTSFLPGDEGRFVAFVRDISRRKRTQEEIRESQERFRMLFDHMGSGVALYQAVEDGEDFVFVDLNSAGEVLSQVDRAEVLGRRVTEVFPEVDKIGLLGLFRRVWRTGEPEALPLTLYKDERIGQWVENHVTRLPSGLIVAMYEDTTEQRRAEQALRDSEEKFRELAELLPEAVFETDMSLRITYANQKAFDLFGYSPEDFGDGLYALDMLEAGDQEKAAATFKNRLEGSDPGVAEYTGVRKDGSSFPVLFHAEVIRREDAAAGLRGIIVDLTERKKAESEIQAGSQRFRNVVESSPMGMHFYELQPDDRLIFVGANPAANRILGVDNAIFVGKTIEEAFPALAESEIPGRYRAAAREGTVWRADQITYEEGEIAGAFEVVAFQTSPGQVAAMFQDVTERMRAQDALEQSEERLRLAARSGQVGVWEYQIPTDTLEWDELMYELHGVAPNSADQGLQKWRDCVHPDDLEKAENELFAALPVGGAPFDTQFRIIRQSDGEIRQIRGLAGVVRDPLGTPLTAIGTNWDITDSEKAREALLASEERFRSVIQQSNDALYILYENRFDLVNSKFCEITGVTPEEAASPGFDFWQLVAEESKPLIKERKEKRERGEPIPDLYEFLIKPKSGPKIHVEASVKEIDYAGGKAILGLLRDITSQKTLENQLNQAQKMESIGRLSGGVAHDLNNLLTPIIGYAELLRDDLSPEDHRRESADEVIRAGFRAKDLVRQLLAFSRRQTLENKPTDLNALVGGFQKLLRRTIREDIDIRVRPQEPLPTIRGDKGQLEQVIMNLAVNAQDAMPQGGTFFIETAIAVFDEEFASSRPGVKPGNYVLLALTDTGEGMDAETRERVFEPFFTTKGQSRGTGLGLATVYGIVKQHGGNIWVYSEPGEGTTFKCYFPVSEGATPSEEVRPVSEEEAGGAETVMIVEDEESVRTLAVDILKRNGYTVTAAADAQECLALLEAHNGPLDLLLTDVVLPGMNGRVLYEEVSRRFPDARVLFMSGYSDEVVSHRGVLEEGISFLQKPFSVQALARKVRAVLDGE